MFDINPFIILFALYQAFVMWYSLFFLSEKVVITKKQELIYVICGLIASYVLIDCARASNTNPNANYIGFFIECTFVILQFILFSEHLWRDFCCLYVNATVVGMLSGCTTMLCNNDVVKYVQDEEYVNENIHLLAIYLALCVIFCFLIRPLILRVFRYHEEYEPVYKMASALMLGSAGMECVLRQKRAYEHLYMLLLWGRFAMVAAVIVIYFYMMIRVKRRIDERNKKRLEKQAELNFQHYERYLEENRNLRAARHELNRYVEMTRQMKPYVASETMKEYLRELSDKNAEFMNVSLSGNIYIDTVLNEHAKKLKEQGIVFETVLEPVTLSKQTEYSMIEIQEEMFRFMNRRISSKEWCRFSIRTRKNKLLCQMEIGYSSDKEYKKRRRIDVLGNQLRVRQDFEQTQRAASQNNGALLYELEKNMIQIGVMFDFA